MPPVLTFDPGPHEYKLDGKVIPSVSQLCTAGGLWDSFKNNSFVKKRLDPAIRGIRIHFATELMDQGKLDWEQVKGTGYEPYLDAWRNCLADTGVKIKEIEVRHHMTLGGCTFAGTVDRVVETPTGEVEIWDIKTGSDHPDPYSHQLAAYKALMEDFLGYEVSKVCCVFIDKKGKYRIRDKTGERYDRKWLGICERFAAGEII